MENKLDYFIQRTEKDFDKLHERMDHIADRVDKIYLWRVKMTGIWVGVSGLVSAVTTILLIYFHGH